AVLDAVVNHLHEVPGAVGPAVQVAVLRRGGLAVATRRPWRRLDAGGDGAEDGVQVADDLVLAADHQAVAPLDAPDPAAGAAVHVVDAPGLELGGAVDVVPVVAVAPVDHDVPSFQPGLQLVHGVAGHACGDH